MKSDRIDLGLTGYDELFMSTEERLDAKKPKVDELHLDKLKPFKDHPFKVMEDEEMERLKESIRGSGVLIPALARPSEDGYELISGHRRLVACKALGMDTMPVIIRDLTDEEAIITMVDSNLQREHILPSEKAFAYKMKMEALKSQGKRTDLTSYQVGTKFDAASEIGKSGNDSRIQVFRYIRLTNLIPEILKLVGRHCEDHARGAAPELYGILGVQRHQSRRQEKSTESVQMEIEHHPRYPDAAGILRRCAEFQNALQVIQKPPPY